MTLTPKQQRFVEEYLVDLNATQAAIRASYSSRTAYSQGQRLLKNAEVQAGIVEAQATRSEQTGITAAWVLEQAATVYREAKSEGDRKNALRALEMCGKHVDVSAFKDGGPTVNVNLPPSLDSFYGRAPDADAG